MDDSPIWDGPDDLFTCFVRIEIDTRYVPYYDTLDLVRENAELLLPFPPNTSIEHSPKPNRQTT